MISFRNLILNQFYVKYFYIIYLFIFFLFKYTTYLKFIIVKFQKKLCTFI